MSQSGIVNGYLEVRDVADHRRRPVLVSVDLLELLFSRTQVSIGTSARK